MWKRTRRSVLIVDDQVETVDLLRFVLFGYRVRSVGTALSALVLAKDYWFDLYVLDFELPDVNGLELCRAIRQFDPNTPIIVSSPAAPGLLEAPARAAGAQRFLPQPIDAAVLQSTVGQLLGDSEIRAAQASLVEAAAIQEKVKRSLDGVSSRLTS